MLSDEIRRLHELHQAGALSDAEFEQAKARVLSGARLVPEAGVAGTDGTSGFGGGFAALRRSRTDRWLGGVCGGIARASGVESWIWRLAFVLFAVTFGAGALAYLLLWIFVPEE